MPGLNEIIEASRENKFKANSQKKKYTEIVAYSCISSGVKNVKGKNDYLFIWFCENKKRDKDNIMAGQKFVFDGLQSIGAIENDGWKQVGNITHKFEVDKSNPRLEVQITRAEDD